LSVTFWGKGVGDGGGVGLISGVGEGCGVLVGVFIVGIAW